MKVLITGARGMLGTALTPELGRQGMEVFSVDREELDVTRAATVDRAMDRFRPDAVVQCAAYTAVDDAEAAPELAYAINAEGARIVASSCQRHGALFVYPSTDYVFSGESIRPYRPDDAVAPLGVYGASKAEGERAAAEADRHLVVRTSWLYGSGGRNFVDAILHVATRKSEVKVVADQVGKPTWTRSLSEILGRLLKAGAVGTFHAADGGEPVCWYQFAGEIFRLRGVTAVAVPISSEEYGAPARRPRNSVLDCTKTEQALGTRMPDRQASLAEYLSSPFAN